jgi:hypothetical protein
MLKNSVANIKNWSSWFTAKYNQHLSAVALSLLHTEEIKFLRTHCKQFFKQYQSTNPFIDNSREVKCVFSFFFLSINLLIGWQLSIWNCLRKRLQQQPKSFP